MKNAKDMSLAARKERAAIEGRNALADYEAQGAAARKNMARLRTLRLAKEAADREADAARIAAEPPAAPKKKKKKSSAPPAP